MNVENLANYEANLDALVAYFDSGSKSCCNTLGVEVEHFLITQADGTPFTYAAQGHIPGLHDVLTHLLKTYPKASYNSEGELIGCANEEANITLEPSAQIEVSIAPFSSIKKIGEAYQHFRETLDPYLAQHHAEVINAGYHPTRKAEELTLIPKERYHLMDKHFSDLGTLGLRMMRATASTQVSIDYTSEADAVRKLRVASALVPILGAITDNISVFEGAPNTLPVPRLAVWRNVDNARAGVVPGVFSPGFGFRAYAAWLLRTSPIFINKKNPDGTTSPVAEPTRTAAEIYAQTPMEKAEIEHLISMFWPDVRLKRFVEIRPADSLPQGCIEGYAALIKGLFYSEESMCTIEDALGVVKGDTSEDALGVVKDEAAEQCTTGKTPESAIWPLCEQDVEDAIAAIRAHGFNAKFYGESVEGARTLRDWESLLFSLARQALPADEQQYLEPLECFATAKNWAELT